MSKETNDAQTAPLPLAGIKVVEMGQNLAGPLAGQILASLGAQVLKIERPGSGDDTRAWGPPFLNGMATAFHPVNHSKKSVALDIKEPESMAWLKRQLAEADVLVHNMRPGVMEELGLDSATLLAVNPRLVYGASSAYGDSGPMATKPGYEAMVQAYAGMWTVNGDENGPPTRVGYPTLDLGTGVWMALGCIAALFRRSVTGQGGVVNGSLLETALAWQAGFFAIYDATGKQMPRHRSGSPLVVVFDTFNTANGEIVVGAANDRLFAKLAKAVGHPEWASDPRFINNLARRQNKVELLGMLQSYFSKESTETWMERLEAVDVPCSPINEYRHMRNDEQIEAIGMFQELPGLDFSVAGLPLRFDGKRPPITSPAPQVGEHNAMLGAPDPEK